MYRSLALGALLVAPMLLLAEPTRADDNTVVAKVNGFDIKMSDVLQAREMMGPEAASYPQNVIYEFLLNSLVNTHLVSDEAKKQNLQKDPGVRRRVDRLEERVLEQEYLIRRVDKDLTEDKLKEAYQQMLKNTPPEEEVRARHILVASEATAMEVLARLQKGEDFAAVAKQVSTDGSAASGGDLGYFTRERMVKPFSDAAFALKPGSYTDKPVRSQFGWHLIKVEDKRMKPPPTYEEAKEEVSAETRRALAESYVAELRKKGKVQLFTPDGKPMPDKAAAPDAGGKGASDKAGGGEIKAVPKNAPAKK
jgi:peptidyl-prolyl cis-trans isomerase C